MKKQYQKVNTHRPEVDEYADCLRTALACLLDRDRDDVPNFVIGLDAWKPETHQIALERVREYLVPVGTLWCVPLRFRHLESVLEWVGSRNPDGRWLLAGGTRYPGVNHIVICKGDKIEWSPSSTVRRLIVQPLWPDRENFEAGMIGINL